MTKPVALADNGERLAHAVAACAAALADPSRVKILCALMDGRAWTATELSAAAEVSASTTSAHLSRLLSGKLISCLSQGRHRYYRLAGSDIAELLESLMGVSWRRETTAKISTPCSLRFARTCYDHLAGEIAVAIFDAMVSAQWLTEDGEALTAAGEQGFELMGIVVNPQRRRKACCGCLDWSERRYHLGGAAGAELFAHCERQGWLLRTPGFREVTLTAQGKAQLRKWFNVAC